MEIMVPVSLSTLHTRGDVAFGGVDKLLVQSLEAWQGWLTNTTECRTLAGKETIYSLLIMVTRDAIFLSFTYSCFTCPNDDYGKKPFG